MAKSRKWKHIVAESAVSQQAGVYRFASRYKLAQAVPEVHKAWAGFDRRAFPILLALYCLYEAAHP